MESIALMPTPSFPINEAIDLKGASHTTPPKLPPKQLVALALWVSRSKPQHVTFEDYFVMLRKNLKPRCAIEERTLDEFNFFKDSCVALSKENRKLKAKIARLEGQIFFAAESNDVQPSVENLTLECETIEDENSKDDSNQSAKSLHGPKNLSLLITIRQLQQHMKDSSSLEVLAEILKHTLQKIQSVFEQDSDNLAQSILNPNHMWIISVSFRESLQAYKRLVDNPDTAQALRVNLEDWYFKLFLSFLSSTSTLKKKKDGAVNSPVRSKLSTTLVALLTCKEMRSWKNNLPEMFLSLFIQRLGSILGFVINWTGRLNKIFASKGLYQDVTNSTDPGHYQVSIDQGLQLVYIIDRVLAGKTVAGMEMPDSRYVEKSWYQLQKVLVEAIWGKDEAFLRRFKEYIPSKSDTGPLSTSIDEPTDIEALIAAASEVVGWEFLGHDPHE